MGDDCMNARNAFFKLQIETDGTYLQVYKEQPGGNVLTIDALVHYFSLIHLEEYDKEEVMLQLKQEDGEKKIKLTDKRIFPVNECLAVTISESEKEAYVSFYPPSNGGKQLTKEEIIDALHHSRVNFGIDYKLIEEWVEHRIYNTKYVIARAKAPVQGRNGRVIYCFNTNMNGHPRLLEDGTVDYHQLDNIVHIEAGAKLAYLERSIPGTPGMSVTGVKVLPARVKEARMKHGRNIVVSEDGATMYSEVSGHAYLVDGKVFVSNIYEVVADVDASTGDIEYDGDIHVAGTVRSGFTLKASGQIFVEGMVEGANLYAEGPIIIQGGIQGMMKANIVSESNITVKYIENAVVRAGGDILTEAIMHSRVSAGKKIRIDGKKGLLVGGEVHARESVEFKVAGSPMGAFTAIEVGLDPDTVKEYRSLQQQICELEKESTKLIQVMSAYRTKISKGQAINPKQALQIRQIAERLKELEKQRGPLLDASEELGEEILLSKEGKVIVQDKVYAGVKIDIAGAVLILKGEAHYCTFIKDGIDVIQKPL